MADETKDFSVTFGALDVSAFEEIPVEVELSVGERAYVVTDEANYFFAARMDTPTFDGKDDEWKGVPVWKVDDVHPTRAPQWHDGPDDIRADVRVAWNDDYLLFFVRTEDFAYCHSEVSCF